MPNFTEADLKNSGFERTEDMPFYFCVSKHF